jgi:hypothetical protein
MDKVQEIQEYLKENDIYGEVSEDGSQLVVSIEWGDWKHDHKRCDYLMAKKNYLFVEEQVTEEDGSDCYSANHYYEQLAK